ncbi:MAG: hypothetical protein JWQ64_658 [Subtercola sp.]|jgi:uncharacterized membrane protein HdeD (DUF308 family)|nr:hypothetical protein [Subtercola sp.]
MAATRPGAVTFVAVLVYINGILDLVFGVLALVAVFAANSTSSALVGVNAIVLIVLGIITIIVARGLLQGSNTSRTIVLILEVISLISGIFTLFSGQFGSGLVTIIWALVVIGILSTRRAIDFFRAA